MSAGALETAFNETDRSVEDVATSRLQYFREFVQVLCCMINIVSVNCDAGKGTTYKEMGYKSKAFIKTILVIIVLGKFKFHFL